MYHAFVKWMARRNVRRVNAGDIEAVLRSYGSGIREGHTVSGEHALGGTRHSVDAMRRYYERLHRLLPELEIQIRDITSSGGPWNTLVAIEWCDRAMPQDGIPYTNEGAMILRIRWGSLVYSRTYPDTQRVVEVCQRLGRAGVEEALAPPIED